jgi:hypothetical protein
LRGRKIEEATVRKHRIKAGIATLALAGAGLAAPIAATGSAQASTPNGHPYTGLVNVVARHVVTGNEIVVLQGVQRSVAAAACGLKVNELSRELAIFGKAFCPALSHNNVHTKVFPA